MSELSSTPAPELSFADLEALADQQPSPAPAPLRALARALEREAPRRRRRALVSAPNGHPHAPASE